MKTRFLSHFVTGPTNPVQGPVYISRDQNPRPMIHGQNECQISEESIRHRTIGGVRHKDVALAQWHEKPYQTVPRW